MELKPIDLLHKKFKRAVRGCDTAEVKEFLRLAAGELERLLVQNVELKEQAQGLEAELRRYREAENTLNNALVLAQRTAQEITANARHEADLILRESRSKAERELEQAQKDLEELRKTRERFAIEFRALVLSCLEACERSQGGGRTEGSSGE